MQCVGGGVEPRFVDGVDVGHEGINGVKDDL